MACGLDGSGCWQKQEATPSQKGRDEGARIEGRRVNAK
jgi:hypothetical protein